MVATLTNTSLHKGKDYVTSINISCQYQFFQDREWQLVAMQEEVGNQAEYIITVEVTVKVARPFKDTKKISFAKCCQVPQLYTLRALR